MQHPRRIEPGPGQESVWDYPRPPRLERTAKRIEVDFGGVTVADSVRAWRVLETSHPPTYYLPPDDVRLDLLEGAGGGSICEWKGAARYHTIRIGELEAVRAAWSYPRPTEPFRPIRGHLAFYLAMMDECRVDGEPARPQPGGFYGGWITSDVVGPFKGEPGTTHW